MKKTAALVILPLLPLAACGGSSSATKTITQTVTSPASSVTSSSTSPAPSSSSSSTGAASSSAPPSSTAPSSPTATSSTLSHTPVVAPTSTTSTAQAATVTRASTCGDTPVVRPTSFTLACADAGETVTNIVWSTWGTEGAVGYGIHSQNDCTPDCADGQFHSLRIRVRLSNPVMGANGRVFSTLTMNEGGDDPQTVSLL